MAQGHVVAANEFRFQHLARRMGSRSPIPIPIPIPILISRRASLSGRWMVSVSRLLFSDSRVMAAY